MTLGTQFSDDPLPAMRAWLDDAVAGPGRNPWAMSLASVGENDRPSCRYVLLKQLDAERGFVVFYTNYASRKAAELEHRNRAAAAMYWPDAGRQLRIEGLVTRSPSTESDAYFATRPRASQLNAWASAQSRPLPEDGLTPTLTALHARFPETVPVPRPDGWGGYRIWLDVIEFWTEGDGRFHERLRYDRDLTADQAAGFTATGWRHARLQP